MPQISRAARAGWVWAGSLDQLRRGTAPTDHAMKNGQCQEIEVAGDIYGAVDFRETPTSGREWAASRERLFRVTARKKAPIKPPFGGLIPSARSVAHLLMSSPLIVFALLRTSARADKR